jgi:hypothetical protein
VVQPLRALRRRLKGGVAPVAPSHAEALRSAIKREELAAERLQQQTLEEFHPAAATGCLAPVELALMTNVAAYESVLQQRFPPQLVSRLSTAVSSMSTPRSAMK